MFIINWLKDSFSELFGYLGLLPENAKIIFLGLDNAGKTTLVHMLKENRLGQLPPTYHPHSEELIIDNRRYRAFDLGGHETARRIWRDYYPDVDGVIFLVDAADRTRMKEAMTELHQLFEQEALKNVPFVIFGNKIDIPTACSEDELRSLLHLPPGNVNYQGGQQQYTFRPNGGPIELFMTSVAKKMGYNAGFKWLTDVLNAKSKGEL